MDNNILKTGYDWCLDANIRVLNLSEWPKATDNQYYTGEDSYFKDLIELDEFMNAITKCTVKANSQPRKTDKFLEYRMYGLVPYNLSPIQQAIQYGHAVVEYGQTVRGMGNAEVIYNKWANEDRTFIILNGGTTNKNVMRLGTLNSHLLKLREVKIPVEIFHEPDLNDALTAVVFLVDERVWNKTLYPDFEKETLPWARHKPSEKQLLALEEKNANNYKNWVEKIGGEKNAFLREFLKGFRLA